MLLQLERLILYVSRLFWIDLLLMIRCKGAWSNPAIDFGLSGTVRSMYCCLNYWQFTRVRKTWGVHTKKAANSDSSALAEPAARPLYSQACQGKVYSCLVERQGTRTRISCIAIPARCTITFRHLRDLSSHPTESHWSLAHCYSIGIDDRLSTHRLARYHRRVSNCDIEH